MVIRRYEHKDSKQLSEMLREEGLKPDEMDFSTNLSFVLIEEGEVKGFYTYKIEHGCFPHLQHFCVKKSSRNSPTVARKLIRDFRSRVKRDGYGKAIINSPSCSDKISKIIEWYFKAKPYGTGKSHKFYLVTV